jgi:hypothetical protein
MKTYQRQWAVSVRVVGKRLHFTHHPELLPRPVSGELQDATVSVWGANNQADIARCRVGIVGLGSVGSIVAECLARVGVSRFVLIDHDTIEWRNLDRTAGASASDVKRRTSKVTIAKRNIARTATATNVEVIGSRTSLLSAKGLKHALDCDFIFSCVDRPWPRHLLNAIAYAHLIPVVDGGIFALVEGERFLHADWRIHTVGPERACLVCLGALDPGDVSLEIDRKLDDPDYIKNLAQTKQRLLSRRNVFPFSLSVASHEVLQFVGCVTGIERIGGVGPQTYHCYPGTMEVRRRSNCEPECDYCRLTAGGANLSGNLDPRLR